MSRLTEKHPLPIKLMVYDHDEQRILSPIVPAHYPVAAPLVDFLRTTFPQLNTASKAVHFLTNVDDRFIERIDVDNPQHLYYHVLVILHSQERSPAPPPFQDRAAFLDALPEGEDGEKVRRFLNIRPLEEDKLLELSTRIVKVKAVSLPTELAHALKGILFLKAESEGVALAYYTGDRILYERFHIQEDGSTRVAERRAFPVYRDIASRNEAFNFHIIRRALARDDLLFVDHFNGQGRELKTFHREETEPETYRDTGNRVLGMHLLEEKQARLDFGFVIRELDLESGFRYMVEYLTAAHQRLAAIHEVGANEWYLLTRDEQHRDYRIYHSRTPHRRLQDPLATFTLPEAPVALLWMEWLQAALIASSTHVYLVEPGAPDPAPRKLNQLLRTSHERFEVSGEVQDLKVVQWGQGEAVAIVQDQRILFTIFEEYA